MKRHFKLKLLKFALIISILTSPYLRASENESFQAGQNQRFYFDPPIKDLNEAYLVMLLQSYGLNLNQIAPILGKKLIYDTDVPSQDPTPDDTPNETFGPNGECLGCGMG